MTMGMFIFHDDVPLAPDTVTSKTVFRDFLSSFSSNSDDLLKSKIPSLTHWIMTGFSLGCTKKVKGDKLSPPGAKPTALVDAVTVPQGFGIKSYLHQFYQSPTVEDMDQSAWYLLPPPPAMRRGLFVCRLCTCIGLLLLIAGACSIVVGYTWPHDTVEQAMHRVSVYQDEEGTYYIPTIEMREYVMRDPMKAWKTAGGKHLASFASEDNSPNEPPVRIYPGQPGLSGPIPAAEEITKVQPSGEAKSVRPTTDDLLAH
ncbi:hypothetical protein PRIPAC_73448 [Pristionchus pacificus]|uniref:Uncharacterized protein n=1 Tax=Pristionchus pacificus TaxID=54126 RepID=A0A2A6C818_PRIPA|nr:hypothetical protein PRIPAC_73448 [Pristionchus pacificus]|eukprot:PDM74218.1 hypothetical protein PRIPAC_41574 [Pristionchus pacificus]